MSEAYPDVAIIGAGPAGLHAATVIARAGRRVALFDRMGAPGRKFLLAGRGGLNITHSEPHERFVGRYSGSVDMAEQVSAFPPEAVRTFVDGHGEATFVGSSGRVFPKSFRATPLLRAWLAELAGLGVQFHGHHRWAGWQADGALAFETRDGPRVIRPGASVLALGGASWPRFGSDGAWVEMLAAAGVPVAPLVPSNCGLEIAWSAWFRDRCAGAPLKPLALTAAGVTRQGEAVLTAEGLEGGAVYAVGAGLRAGLAAGQATHIDLDLRPTQTVAQLAAALTATRPRDSLKERCRKAWGLDAAGFALLRETGRPGALRELPGDPAALAGLIKAIRVQVSGFRPIDRAISTAGGVRADALTPAGMLRARPGVFVAGEMLDWDAPTGGYLLQGCFATAEHAARGVLDYLKSA
jgi:uncharacterized flavoprotein (TIGR03862 family)